MTFSVIVPTYNRLSQLKKTLTSLFGQSFTDYEIIVVNDGGTDETHEYLTQLASQGKLVYYKQVNSGPAIARNLGLKNANGDYIAFTDDDCIVPKDWLKKYHEYFQNNSAAGLGGASRTGDESNLFAVTNDVIVNFLKNAINTAQGSQITFLTTNNTVYKKSSLEKVGGFDKCFRIGAEERDLNYRLHMAGEVLQFDGSIVVDHYNDANFSKFLHHQFDQGKGSYIFYRNALSRFGERPALISIKIYLQLLVYPFKTLRFIKALAVCILIVLAQAAVFVGYFAASFSKEIKGWGIR